MLHVPVENLLAVFPARVRAGGVELSPLTIRDAVLLAVYGVDFTREIRGEFAVLAGAVLSGAVSAEDLADGRRAGKALSAFARPYRRLLFPRRMSELERGVNEIVDKAFATRVLVLGNVARISLTPSGLGWTLEIAETICHEYGWSWEETLRTPVATAYALLAAAHRRNGGKFGGPDYIERIVIARRKKGGANG